MKIKFKDLIVLLFITLAGIGFFACSLVDDILNTNGTISSSSVSSSSSSQTNQ